MLDNGLRCFPLFRVLVDKYFMKTTTAAYWDSTNNLVKPLIYEKKVQGL